MIEYVTTAHQTNYEKKNDVSHLLKPKSPPAKSVNIVINNTKTKEHQLHKSNGKCLDNAHSHAKRSKLGLQEDELIIVSKPQDEPPFL